MQFIKETISDSLSFGYCPKNQTIRLSMIEAFYVLGN